MTKRTKQQCVKYLSNTPISVIDLYSRQIGGWTISELHDADLATTTLNTAIRRQQPTLGLIVHSDRETEFVHQQAQEAHIQLSMRSTGNCYDNASAKSVFATIKLEAVQGHVFQTRQLAKQILFDYIKVFYNRQRLHSGIGYNCPASYATWSLLQKKLGSRPVDFG